MNEFRLWLDDKYPYVYSQTVFELTEEQKAQPNRFYYDATHDFRYDQLEAMWIKLFISDTKKWKDDAKTMQYSYDHPRRYHDALLKCCEVSDFELHPQYRSQIKSFLENLKKEKATAKANNQLTENDSDPIGMPLLERLCLWCVSCGSLTAMFVWAFIVTQWNLMGRTVNVDPLGFHNIKKGDHDCIIISFDKNKCDRKGEKTTPKHCYANPKKPLVNLFLALGIYLSVYQNKFEGNEKIFQAEGKDGSASKSFVKGLRKIIEYVSDVCIPDFCTHCLTFLLALLPVVGT